MSIPWKSVTAFSGCVMGHGGLSFDRDCEVILHLKGMWTAEPGALVAKDD